jgi:alkanesulfonate monooxygenase SsuD/methylene tetrahydromethanopterin reductase-like flavin-dependent oxidoreductase (luciferase family)
VLSNGRVEPVVRRGTFFPYSLAAFGHDPSTAQAVFAENLELLVELWTKESVTWSGSGRLLLASDAAIYEENTR